MTGTKAARVLSEIFAPWVSNILFFLILGAATGSWPGAVTAALGTGVLPMVAIIALMRRGSVGNHHVTRREQRLLVLVVIAVIVIATIGLLWMMSAAHLVMAGLLSALVFLAVFGVVTAVLKIKASIHVGLWVCLAVFLAVTVSPWFVLALVALPAIAWARYKIEHHTSLELAAGILTGALVSGVCIWLFA